MWRYSTGPAAPEPGPSEQTHGGLTDIHEGRVNVPCRHGALERYTSENSIELGVAAVRLACRLELIIVS